MNAKLKQTTKLLGIFALAVCCHAHAQTFLVNGLVAYYPFKGDASDATGHGNNGQVYSARLVPDRFGHPDAAYAFSGSNSFVLLTNSFELPDDWTVTAWARATDATATNQHGYIFHIGTDESANPQLLSTNANGFGVYCTDGFIASLINGDFWWGAGALPETSWFQVVMRQTGGSTALFVNGIFREGWGLANGTRPQISPVQGFIGAGSTKAAFYNGTVDDVRVYNRSLTDFEIQQLYAYEAGPVVSLQKAVRPAFSNLLLGTNYQLQASTDLTNWTNQGSIFTATNAVMPSQQYFDVDAFNGLFFFDYKRLRNAPDLAPNSYCTERADCTVVYGRIAFAVRRSP